MESDASACVGFIGLGLLGQTMAPRLAAQCVALVVWNREPERCLTPPQAAAYLRAQTQKWADVIRAANIQPA